MSWMMAGSAAVSIGSGLLSGRSAKKAQRAQDQLKQQVALGQTTARQHYGNRLLSAADEYRDSGVGTYQPVTVNNGFATSNVDPVTGQVGYTLDPRWAGERDRLMGGSQGMFGRGDSYMGMADDIFAQAKDFDPRTHAADRYSAAQGLLAETDARNQQGLMQDLYAKGGYGLTTNSPAAATVGPDGQPVAGAGSVGVNPYVDTFLNAQNRRNAQMSYDSLREGESYLDGIIGRGKGMFGLGMDAYRGSNSMLEGAAGIERNGQGVLREAGLWGDTLNNYRRSAFDKYMGYKLGGYQEHRDADLGYYGAIGGMDPGAGANGRSQLFSSVGNSLSGLFSGGAMGSLFGGGGGGNALFQSAYGPGPSAGDVGGNDAGYMLPGMGGASQYKYNW